MTPARMTRRRSGLYVPRAGAGPSDAYGAAVYADSPKVFIRFDEASTPANGASYVDTMGNAGRGAVQFFGGGINQSTSLQTSPPVGGHAAFSNGGRSARIPYGSWMDGTDFAVDFLMNAGSNGVIFLGDWTGSNATSRWYIWRNGFNLTFSVCSGSSRTDLASSPGQATGVVYHVAASLSGTSMSLWLNGSLATATAPGTINASGNGIQIMGDYASSSTYVGLLDDIAFYSPRISATRVAAHNAVR